MALFETMLVLVLASIGLLQAPRRLSIPMVDNRELAESMVRRCVIRRMVFVASAQHSLALPFQSYSGLSANSK